MSSHRLSIKSAICLGMNLVNSCRPFQLSLQICITVCRGKNTPAWSNEAPTFSQNSGTKFRQNVHKTNCFKHDIYLVQLANMQSVAKISTFLFPNLLLFLDKCHSNAWISPGHNATTSRSLPSPPWAFFQLYTLQSLAYKHAMGNLLKLQGGSYTWM